MEHEHKSEDFRKRPSLFGVVLFAISFEKRVWSFPFIEYI